MNANAKPSRTARKLEEREARAKKLNAERAEKEVVRRRDRICRFPLCGCRRLGLKPEVSHDFHKGMGSKDGVSIACLMILVCSHRHQFGSVSFHLGTLRTVYLTPDQNDGPVAWEADLDTLVRKIELLPIEARKAVNADGFIEIAREEDVQKLQPLLPWQSFILGALASMKL